MKRLFLLSTGLYLLALPYFYMSEAGGIAIIAISLFYSFTGLAFLKTRRPTHPKDAPHDYLRELEIAKRVQQALLTIETPEIHNIEIAKKCVPAASLGGDFYTFINKGVHSIINSPNLPGVVEYKKASNDRYFGVAIGDVAGHGVSSALVMALSAGLIDKIGQNNSSPSKTLSRANQDIRKYIHNSQISYVTAFYAAFNLDTNVLTYSKAGHLPALLHRKEGEIEELSAKGIFLGMFENETYEEKTCQLETGDRIVFYTDGITETQNVAGEFFGLDRLKRLMIEKKHLPINDVLDEIFDQVQLFASSTEAKDDQTVVILQIKG